MEPGADRFRLKEKERKMSDTPMQSLAKAADLTVVWHGRATEYQDLVSAVRRNCGCEYGMGVRTCCSAHRMIAED
jgi:hypothetical protein